MTATAENASPRPRLRSGVRLVGDYVALTRPRILGLVLLTAPPALLLGGQPAPAPATVLGVLLGTLGVGAGCGALNAWIERKRDARMERTRSRPLPAGRIAPTPALCFGLALSAAGLLVLWLTGGPIPAALGALALLNYIFVYTLWLKPRSPHAVVVGGAAGAAAPLIADAAVDGRVGPWGLVLFAFIFLWQPAHFWAIALYRQSEYAAAGFPVLPLRAGRRPTRRWSLAYALALVPFCLAPSLLGGLGAPSAAVALTGSLWLVFQISAAMRSDSDAADRRVFHASIVQLASLFAVMSLELLAPSLGIAFPWLGPG